MSRGVKQLGRRLDASRRDEARRGEEKRIENGESSGGGGLYL